MSDNQVEGLICICANIVFSRNKFGKWKRYDKDHPTDNNTLPATTNSNRTEAYDEALIFAGVANKIMLPDSHTVVTYSHDGSAQSSVGNYVVFISVYHFQLVVNKEHFPQSVFHQIKNQLKRNAINDF